MSCLFQCLSRQIKPARIYTRFVHDADPNAEHRDRLPKILSEPDDRHRRRRH